MSLPNGTAGIDASGLRERLPQNPDQPLKAESGETAQKAVQQLNEQESAKKDEKQKKTYGRTPDGTGEYLVYLRPAGLGMFNTCILECQIVLRSHFCFTLQSDGSRMKKQD